MRSKEAVPTAPGDAAPPATRRSLLRRWGALGAGAATAVGGQVIGAAPASAAGSDFRARRATERRWRLINPVLPAGTLAVATDTHVLKVGDGRRRWASLPSYVPESRLDAALTRRIEGLKRELLLELADDSADSDASGGTGETGDVLLERRFVQLSHRPVNLRDRIPAGNGVGDPADAWVAAAIADSTSVEWPAGLALTFTDPSGLHVPEGTTLRAEEGARATIAHAGPGVRVAGTLHGLAVDRPVAATVHDVGVLVVPASVRPRVSAVSVEGGTACFAVGGHEGAPGSTVDALLVDCTGRTTAASSFVFRIDESENVELLHCRALGSQLDAIKLRRRSRQVRVVGGHFTGAVAGDGLDGFAGAEQVYIGGGAFFHDNGHNGLVVKTDDLTGLSLAEQAATFGTPQRIVIDGVLTTGNGGSGIALHRSDATDSDVAAGVSVPWLRGVSVANAVSADNGGFGLFLNLRTAHVSGVIASRNRQDGVRVHAHARDVTLSGVHALGNGTPGAPWDGFHLAGQRIWLSQCMAFGVDSDAVTDADLAAATKVSRYGFRIASGALVHLAQCGSFHNATAPISDSDGRAVLVDCDLGAALRGALALGGGPRLTTGPGTPQGVVSAGPGSIFCRSDGSPGAAVYVKTAGTGTSGWIAIA